MGALASYAIVSLEDTKAQLNIDLTNDDFDAQLGDFINTASQMIVNRIGRVAGSPTVTEWHDGGSPEIVLRNQAPIQSVTTVLESYGSIVYTLNLVDLSTASTDMYGYSVDLTRGLLIRRASGIAIPFASGLQNVKVVYVGGQATVPADIYQATLVLIDHLWETQRGPKQRGNGPRATEVSMGYALPNRVMEMLAPYIVPGIA